ncbi:MAG: hypothetical protein GF347_00200 [Candidatus Moranbacteria bacterium]|nr:hypothetical protein [Candidatus Moranbacteria bacterium]
MPRVKFERTYREFLSIQEVLRQLGALKAGIKFALWVAHNAKELAKIEESFREATAPAEAFKAYEEKRHQLCASCSIQNEDGPRMKGASYDIDPEKKEEFEAKLKELQEECPDHQKLGLDYSQRLAEALDEKHEAQLFTLEEKYLPDNVNGNLLVPVVDLLVDSEQLLGE